MSRYRLTVTLDVSLKRYGRSRPRRRKRVTLLMIVAVVEAICAIAVAARTFGLM